jgi:hypothetical protein
MTGIAAILRFEMPDLEDQISEDEGDLDSDDEAAGGVVIMADDDSNSDKKSRKAKHETSEADSGSVGE